MQLKPLTSRPLDCSPVYYCAVCGTAYRTQEEARYCTESYPVEQQYPDLAPGDVVTLNRGNNYGWYKDERWIAETIPANPKSRSHFDHITTYSFYYVVTAIHVDDAEAKHPRHFEDNRRAHRAKVSLAHGAIWEGDEMHVFWTVARSHYTPTKVKDQTAVQHLRALAAPLIGTKSNNLL